MTKHIFYKNRICLLIDQVDKNEYRILCDNKIIHVFKCHDEKGHEAWGDIRTNTHGKYWYLAVNLHREDGPAIEYCNGTKHWYEYGKFAHSFTTA